MTGEPQNTVNGAIFMDRDQPIGNTNGTDGRGRLHVFAANTLAEPVPVSVVSGGGGSAIPSVSVVGAPTAGTEYSYTFPASLISFIFQARSGRARIRIAFAAGQTADGGNYFTVHPGNSWSDGNFGGKTVYFRTDRASETIEIPLSTSS